MSFLRILPEGISGRNTGFIKMMLSSVFSLQEFEQLKKYLPLLEYDKNYSDDETDSIDEKLDELNQKVGYESKEEIFISDMIYKFRSNAQY